VLQELFCHRATAGVAGANGQNQVAFGFHGESDGMKKIKINVELR
jgi:hypothetical protein